jgi:hypothetical protein
MITRDDDMREELYHSACGWCSRKAGGLANHWKAVITVAFVLVKGVPALGGYYAYFNPPPWTPEPANHNSFVRDAVGQMVARDSQYAVQVSNNVTAGSVDFLFVQCYGGGFLNDLLAAGPGKMTATTASRWDEPAFSDETVNLLGWPGLNNYTAAWLTVVAAKPSNGFRKWRDVTSFGTENPIYASADATPYGANDTRTLANNSGNQYAILVAWSESQTRHSVNLARVYFLLMNVFHVPQDNIVVLQNSFKFGETSTDYSGIGGYSGVGGPIPMDGNNSQATWLNALRGLLFTTGMKNPGSNIPGPDDQLFIYNTGHGGEMINGEVVQHNLHDNADTISGSFSLAADGFAIGYSLSDPEASSVMNTNGTVLLQLQLSQPIYGATITLNGVPTNADLIQVTDPTTLIYDYGFTNAVTYQWTLSEDWLSITNPVSLSISGLLPSAVENTNLVLVVSFIGGDQEVAYVNAGSTNTAPTGSTNIAPTGSYSMYRYTNVTAKALLSRIVTNASSPLGNQVSFLGLDSVSAAGIPVSTDGTWVFYDAPFGFNTGPAPECDTFGLDLEDSQGNLGLLTVSVYVIPPSNHVTLNLISVSNTPPGTMLTFAGIPGLTNIVEFSDQLPATNWTQFAGPVVCGQDGKFTVTDPTGGTQRYYRTLIYWP